MIVIKLTFIMRSFFFVNIYVGHDHNKTEIYNEVKLVNIRHV